MANTFAPFGFRQYSGNGSAPTYELVEMQIASNYTTPIFYGDAVLQDANGTITRAGDAPTTQLAGTPDGTMTRDHAQVKPNIKKSFEAMPVPEK